MYQYRLCYRMSLYCTGVLSRLVTQCRPITRAGCASLVYGALFWGAFAWIYLQQWFLYTKVNELYAAKGKPEPIERWWLFAFFGLNFVAVGGGGASSTVNCIMLPRCVL